MIFLNPLGIGFYPSLHVPGWLEGEYVKGTLKLPALGTLRNCWPGLSLSIPLNGVMKRKREKGSGALE